jgi:hypothetical protein
MVTSLIASDHGPNQITGCEHFLLSHRDRGGYTLGLLASIGQRESCPKNGDVPNSPLLKIGSLMPSAGTIITWKRTPSLILLDLMPEMDGGEASLVSDSIGGGRIVAQTKPPLGDHACGDRPIEHQPTSLCP